MDEHQKTLILQSAALFPPPEGLKLSYGTSGFRADSSLLESTIFRVGILAALRSLKTGSVIGLMITASHNVVSDNGVKVADPSGGMLTQEWEPFSDQLASAPSPSSVLELIDSFVNKENIPLDGRNAPVVLLGRDTRPSGTHLMEAAKQGVASIVGAIAKDVGVVTTPQLHWMVRQENEGMEASEHSYFDQLATSFRDLMGMAPQRAQSSTRNEKLIVDCADGVGGEKLESLKRFLTGLSIEVRNRGEGVLNEGVGAEFVQKERTIPRNFHHTDAGSRCASLDGDADRIVYFSINPGDKRIHLVDGDKILSLFALFIKNQLDLLETPCRLGVVQTAYANGASTGYLKSTGLEVALTRTGVKHLHEKAGEFDIGVYFEANGHGTVRFSDSVLNRLESLSEENRATSILLAVSKLVNQAVGDALSDLLLVEVILLHMGWSFSDWSRLYDDLPSRQIKVKVVDRSVIVTSNAETVVVSPPGFQQAIDIETEKYGKGRCFVRPSGTEDVVRIYAEASSQEEADALANSVATLVEEYLGFGNS